MRANKKKVIREAHHYVWEYLSSHPCAKCGENDPVVLEFDHVRGRKRMSISNMAKDGYSIAAIEKEIAKCQILCANCHRRNTSRERGRFSG